MAEEQIVALERRVKQLEKGFKSLQMNLKDIPEIKDDIKEIKEFILGNLEFQRDGMLQEHKNMYSVYNDFKPKFNVISEMIESFKNERFLKKYFAQIVTGVGVANIITFIIYVITFLVNFTKTK